MNIPRKKPGRPSKFTGPTRRKILRSVSRGMPLVRAANAAGLSFQSLQNYRHDNSDFAEAITQAMARGLELRLRTIEQAAKNDWRAAAWWCEHVFPSDFAKTRIEVTGNVTGQLLVLTWPHNAPNGTSKDNGNRISTNPVAEIAPNAD